MNKVILMGRLTREPEVRYTQGENQMAVGRFSLAVDRRKTSRNEEQSADFISCVSFGKTAEFLEKYVRKGTKIVIAGHIQTGSYTNKEGSKVYTTDVVVDELEFAESKNSNSGNNSQAEPSSNFSNNEFDAGNDFMNIPADIEGLPFN